MLKKIDIKKRNRNNFNRGKNFEKSIAKILSGIRIGYAKNVDVITDKFAIECKTTKRKLPYNKIFSLLEKKIEINRIDKIPLIIFKEKNKKSYDSFVVLKLKDFKKIIENK